MECAFPLFQCHTSFNKYGVQKQRGHYYHRNGIIESLWVDEKLYSLLITRQQNVIMVNRCVFNRSDRKVTI